MSIREPFAPTVSSARSPDSLGAIDTPEELRLVGAHLPSVGQPPTLPAAGSSTPGIALAAARVPGAPTLPDGDPVSLTLAIQRMANELFAPGIAMPLDDRFVSNATTPSVAGPHASTPSVSSPSVPSTAEAARSPFDGSLDFTPVTMAMLDPTGAMMSGMQFPLLDPTRGAGAADVAGPEPTSAPLNAKGAPIEVPTRHGTPATQNAPGLSTSSVLPSTSGGAPAPMVASSERAGPAGDPARAWPYELDVAPDLGLRSSGGATFDAHALKREFPILSENVHGKRLVWLDNAATTQKPQTVIDRISHFYEHENSNIHRGAHTLAARATDAYESARESVRRFVNASSAREIVFVRGATEGINLIAQSWGRRNVEAGDEIVVSWLEHHANIVPWQQLCSEKGARLRVAPVDDRGQVILDEYEKLLGPKTRLVSFTQVSNALGTITPAKEMIEMAHRHGAKVLLDGAQAVSHMRVDVQALDCDFYVCSGHKVFAPTGIGAVFGRRELLDAMPPWQGGGNMIQDVTFERTLFQPAPARFEAGTGNIADAVGFGAALDWLSRVGIENVERHEHELLVYGTEQLHTVPGLTIIGTAAAKAGVLSFVLAGQKTEEVGGMLDREGIAVRSGHHCAQPILRRFGLEASVRASLAPYNTREDIDALVASLQRIQAGRATQH